MKKDTFDKIVPSAPPARFDHIERPYSAADVLRLRGSVRVVARTIRFERCTSTCTAIRWRASLTLT